MNFETAMINTVSIAKEQRQVAFLYFGDDSLYLISLSNYGDWLFRAYPGGRKELSRKGLKFKKEIQGENTVTV